MNQEEKEELHTAGYEPRDADTERIDLLPVVPKPWIVFQQENILACYVCKTFQLLEEDTLEISFLQERVEKFAAAHKPCLNSVARVGRQGHRHTFKCNEHRLHDALRAAAVLYIEYAGKRSSKREIHVFEHPKLGKFEIAFRREGQAALPRKLLLRRPAEIEALESAIRGLLPIARHGNKYRFDVSDTAKKRWAASLKNASRALKQEPLVAEVKQKSKRKKRCQSPRNDPYGWSGS